MINLFHQNNPPSIYSNGEVISLAALSALDDQSNDHDAADQTSI